MTVRVMLADDHSLFREGLRALLGRLEVPNLVVVADAETVHDTLCKVRRHMPDLLVLDLKMPGGQPIELVRTLGAEHPELKILVLTMYDDPAFLRSVLAAGARGYLLKRSAYSAFAEAVHAVLRGSLFVDRSLRLDITIPPEGPTRSVDTLTPRERDVLKLLARGLTYSDVGRKLSIGARTVETHRRKVVDKLGLESRADLLRVALESGLLTPGDVEELER